jgi:TRAP-type C4-dicarboxylate transport system substrate-binding protein
MKKNHTIFCIALSLAVVLLIGGSPIAAGEIKLALDCPPDAEKCGTYLWSKTFSDYLESKGVKVKLYPKDALGGEAEKLDQVSQGLLEISNSDLAKAGSLDPTVFGFYLPFLFEDMDHFFRVLAKTEILDKINAGTTKQGVRVLGLVPVGDMAGIATTKKFIKTPTDFAGIRMRALDKKQAKWLEIWGANAVVIPWPEIYNALQTGVADGYMNPAFVPVMFKHTEVLKYYSDVKLAPALRVAICSEDWYKGLSQKDRAIVDEGVAKAAVAVRAWVKKAEAQGLDALKKAGMLVYINTSKDKAKFAALIRPNYTDIVPEEIAKMFIQAAKKQR